jgi:hypothetical protein
MSALTQAVTLSLEAWEEYRTLYRSDPWEFALDICGFTKLVERFHKPVIYIFTHQTALLIEVLKGPLRSAVITKIKAALRKKGLDYNDPADFDEIDEFLLKANVRIFRKGGKSSCGQAAILWDITVDPDHAWAIVSRDDPAAEAMCSMIVKIIQGDAYRFFFPDRIPEDERTMLTQSSIELAGRTKNIAQPCVTAAGVDSGWVSMHFDRIYCDDLVGRENKSAPKLKVVREFQANKNGLKMPEWDEPFYDITTGTRWAANDDSKVLDADPDCLTVYVMIEERASAVTFGNMLNAHEPTLPEWFDKRKIAKEKADYIKDKELGRVALLANLFLTIAADGAKVFSDDIVDSRRFHWYEENEFEPKRNIVARLADPEKPKTSSILKFHTRAMERKAGADPAESMTGDPWAITLIARDPLGTHYQLRTVKGQGAHGFLDSLLYIDETYNPDQIGVEKAAMQGWVLIAIEKDARFSGILHKFVPVSTNHQSKRGRAENLVAAPLEMGELYLAPDDDENENPLPHDMKEWDPDNKKADDASIDATGIAMALHRTPATGTTTKEIEAMAKADNDRYEKSIDKDFGIPIEDVMADEYVFDDYGEESFEFDDEAVGF